MFEQKVIEQVCDVAAKSAIEPAALLAVVEVESAGKSLEPADGRTPQLLFERHIFYRELKRLKPNKLQEAVSKGLAIPKWNRSTQYRDEGTSAKRLALLAQAKAVDVECAIRSCSWGVGQTMGFLAEEMGFANAREMLNFMITGGIPAQVDCMVREIKRKGLDQSLNEHEWADFAYGYNGAGYAANQYDTRIAAAYRKWVKALDPKDSETGEEPVDMRQSRAPETQVQPITASPIANGTLVTGGLTVTAVISMIFDQLAKIPGKLMDAMLALFEKPYFWAALGVVGSAAFVYYKRWKMKQHTGV